MEEKDQATNTAPKKSYDFENFSKKVRNLSPTSSYYMGKRLNAEIEPVCGGRLDLDDINHILEHGSIDDFRRLSHYSYRTSGIYRNACLYLANLSLFQTLVTPIFNIKKKVSKDATLNRFYDALVFVDNLEVPINFSRISLKVILDGTYYGILREDGNSRTIQDLPEKYCRSRFKDCHNLHQVEFNVQYFDTIIDKAERLEYVNTFPLSVRARWRNWMKKTDANPWITIPAEEGGCCFRYGDGTPLFITVIPIIYQLQKAIAREAKRDENELYKLLIQKMPIEKGELVFQLEEVADIHASVADMLGGIDTVDVLTTFGDTSLESVQDTNASAQSANRIDKYSDSVYDAIGESSLIFNSDTSSALPYSAAKDEAILSVLIEQYAKWIEFQTNARFAKQNLTFDVSFLPTTRVNRKEVQSQLFQAAQYGYSKMAAGVATGIKQVNIIPIMKFENEFLRMSEEMLPLMSTYTTSNIEKEEKINNNGRKAENSSSDNDITNEGGRPKKDPGEISPSREEQINRE